MEEQISVYIEIGKHSNIKYEYDCDLKQLLVDRVLPYPFFYPYAYGFIENTLAMDNDELDALIITDKMINNDAYYDVYIVGVLIMEDESGMDEKILCVFEEDYDKIKDIDHLSDEIKNNIHWFFSNYKSKSPNKWSRVMGYKGREYAIDLYHKSKIGDKSQISERQ
jgi:inorganic pyrophosphatase